MPDDEKGSALRPIPGYPAGLPTFRLTLADPQFLADASVGIPEPDVERTLLITGPPRTGTSMVAGILYHHGVELGKRVNGPADFNEMGLYEDELVVKFNNHSLVSAGGSWLSPPPESGFNLISNHEMLDLLVRWMAGGIWGVKDGRIALTMPMWGPVCEAYKPALIFCHRNPVAAAKSMSRWWGLSISTALRLQALYVERLSSWLCQNDHWPVLHVSYEDFIADPIAQAGRLCEFAGVEMDEDVVREFVRPDLKHF